LEFGNRDEIVNEDEPPNAILAYLSDREINQWSNLDVVDALSIEVLIIKQLLN
jgi:hypothetical protein